MVMLSFQTTSCSDLLLVSRIDSRSLSLSSVLIGRNLYPRTFHVCNLFSNPIKKLDMCPLPCSDHNPSSVSTSVSPSASAQKSPGYKLSIHRECCCIDSGSSF